MQFTKKQNRESEFKGKTIPLQRTHFHKSEGDRISIQRPPLDSLLGIDDSVYS